MKRCLHVLLIALCVLGLSSATALAKRKSGPTYVPPNQSAASQYTEDVPTAGGNTPTSGIGGGGGSGGSSGGSGAGAIPAKTLHQLDHRGRTGAAAAALATSLAPATPPASRRASSARTHGSTASTRRSTAGTAAATARAQAAAPAAQVIKTLGGADAGGGIGFVLPLILVLSLVGATGLGLLRIRRTT